MTALSPVSQPASPPSEAAPATPRTSLWARTGLKTGHWLGLILVGHIVLALWYSLVIPPWEAHDEWPHFRHAAYIAENLALPDPGKRLTTEFEFDEASQPPLYYLLAAAPMLAVDLSDGYRPVVNPYASRGTGEGGVNFVLHDPAAESWPWQGTLLALHLGRLASILISTLALYAAWLLLRLLSPDRASVALAGVGLMAFAPQFVFLSAVMTNDILLVAVETALLYVALLLVRDGLSARGLLVLGTWVALGLLSKYLALAMLPVALAAVLIAAWQHRHQPGQRRQRWLALPLLLLPLILLSGWFLIRNLLLTGQPLSRDPISQAALLTGLQGGGALALAWHDIPFALRYGFETYWASFGWGNIGAPAWVYAVWLALIAVGLVGLLVWLRHQARRRIGPLLLVVAIFIAAVVGLPLLRELLHDSRLLRGRYVMATLPLAAWVIAQGWQAISGRLWSWLNKALLLWSATLTLYLAFALILPAYRPPYRPPSAQLAAASPTASPLLANFGGKARLLSADIGNTQVVTPGQGLAVTLTWEVLDRTEKPYTLAIHLLGAGGLSYGSATSYPGNGNAATTVWQPGSHFTETYWLTVRPSGSTPARGQIQISLFHDGERAEYLPVFDNNGNPVGDTATFGELRIERPAGAAPPADLAPPLASFGAASGDRITLLSARFPTDLPQRPGWATPFVLRWRAQTPGSDSFAPMQLSLQLLDANGVWVAGADGPVDDNLPVSIWRAGDLLETVRWLELPPDLHPGPYQVIAVLYRPDDLSRLPAFDAAGRPLPNDALPLGPLLITAN